MSEAPSSTEKPSCRHGSEDALLRSITGGMVEEISRRRSHGLSSVPQCPSLRRTLHHLRRTRSTACVRNLDEESFCNASPITSLLAKYLRVPASTCDVLTCAHPTALLCARAASTAGYGNAVERPVARPITRTGEPRESTLFTSRTARAFHGQTLIHIPRTRGQRASPCARHQPVICMLPADSSLWFRRGPDAAAAHSFRRRI